MNRLKNYSNNLTNQRDHIFCIAIIVILLLRICMADRLPIYIISDSPHDDGWVVSRANALLTKQWFGPYNQYTLIKGAFSPLLMALSKLLGITFMHLNTLLYCAACIFFLIAIEPLFKGRVSKLFCFLILLFNPATFALETWQRVYRNGLSQWQVLFIFGGIIALYIRRERPIKELIPWSVMTGISLWGFINTREDGIWIYPFVLFSTLITIGTIGLKGSRRNGQGKTLNIKKVMCFVLPIIILISGNIALSLLNYVYYGTAITNDRTKGYYAKVIKDLYLIERDREDEERFSTKEYQDQYLNITTNTLEKAYAVSPTLASARDSINQAIIMWDSGEAMVDGEPYLDHMLFALRDGVAAAGYYKELQDTEQFYQKVHNELGKAYSDGRLKKSGVSLSAGAAPVKKEDITPLFREFYATAKYVLLFQDLAADVATINSEDESAAMFEDIAGGNVVYSPDMIAEIHGWAFAYDNDTNIELFSSTSDGDNWTRAQFMNSIDVYEYFKSNGVDYTNASTARFNLEVPITNSIGEEVIRFYDGNGVLLKECPIDTIVLGQGCFEERFCYLIDDITQKNSLLSLEYANAKKIVERVNIVTDTYRDCSIWLAGLAVVAYIFNSIIIIIKGFKRIGNVALAAWLLQTGILLSIMVFLLCISYMTVTTFNARVYLYLSPVYVLMLAFYGVSISTAFETYVMLRKSKRQR